MKTIKQIADEIGVSKQAIQKRLSREPLKSRLYPYIDTRQGTKYIASTGEKLIIDAFSSASTDTGIDANTPVSVDMSIPVSIDKNTNVYTLVATLQEQLAVKDKQIESQQRQLETRDNQISELTAALENTTASLKAAQALHAGTMHRQLSENSTEEETITPDPAKTGEFNKIDLENSTPQQMEPEITLTPDEQDQIRPRFSWWPFGRKN